MSATPTFREALRFWLKLGCISFGGPTGQIAVMHAELVERRKWIGEDAFLRALNVCMLLPGPEATQLATYCGWRLHGLRGGLAAGVLFVLPAAGLLWALSWLYVTHGSVPWIAAGFNGLKPAVTAIVVAAGWRLGRRALPGPWAWVLAAAAFGALCFLRVPFPVIVVVAAGLGLWAGPRWQRLPGGPPAGGAVAAGARPWRRAARFLAVGLVLWWLPVLAAGLTQGWGGVLCRQGLFFSEAAVVTFGGAYAVLPHVAQRAVEVHGWLTPGQMLDGLGLAETTPGPLIMVVQFVGFLGGWHQPGEASPLAMATLGAAITTWTTFVPSYLWILLLAPHVEAWSGAGRWGGALAAVTAAVVGVVANLAVWFAAQVFWPGGGRLDLMAVSLALAAFVALQSGRVGVVPVVLAGGLVGLLRGLVG